jgi:hypothetical protein
VLFSIVLTPEVVGRRFFYHLLNSLTMNNKIRTESTPQVSIEYADGKGEFCTDVFYNVERYDAENQKANAPISCTVQLSTELVISDLRPIVMSALALLNPPSQQPQVQFAMSFTNGVNVQLTVRQCQILYKAVRTEIRTIEALE